MKTKILVLPGMGDIYWVLVKLQSFLEYHKLSMPELYTWELQPQKANRSADYIKRVPFVTYGGAWYHDQRIQEFRDLYFGTRYAVRDFKGFDYFLSYNGILRNGFSLDTFDEHKCNWYFDLTESQTQNAAREQYKDEKYIVAYFTDDGMYSETWLEHLPPSEIYKSLVKIHEKTGYKFYLTGGKWDVAFADQLMAYDTQQLLRNVVGKTSIDQLFGMIESSQGMIGWCGGNTIMSAYFKKPTLVIWSKYFSKEGFYKYCVPPDSLDVWYKYKVAEQTDSDDIATAMTKLCGV